MAIQNKEKLTNTIVVWIQNKMKEAGTEKLEIDISGGIDSGVTAALCVLAAGSENVIGVYSSCHSSDESRVNAQAVADAFDIRMADIDFSEAFDRIVASMKSEFKKQSIPFPDRDSDENRVVFGSLRSTMRAPIGRFANRAFGGGIRVGTGNRDEDELLRFYQKGGDGEVDLNPIAGLFKSEVWELADYLNVPVQVIEATPTPDLWGKETAHTDEAELSELLGVALTYTRPEGPLGTIEWVSRENEKNGVITGKESGTRESVIQERFGYNDEQIKVIQAVRQMERITRHKAEPPPYLEREVLSQADIVS